MGSWLDKDKGYGLDLSICMKCVIYLNVKILKWVNNYIYNSIHFDSILL